MSATEVMQKRFAAALMPNYGLPQLALARGEGCRVWDADGREYLDLFAGIAVSSLGHAHPALVGAVTGQVSALAHTSNLFLHEPGIALAERLWLLLGPGTGPADGRIFFANSGAEANEAAIKLVRRYRDRRDQAQARPVLVATENGFHGRTMGALALTGKASIREPFGPFGIDVRFVPYGDADALRAAAGPDCAAVFVEPCQGEAGVIPPPPGYLRAAREACDASGALLVIDEIQSGIGRTGHWFAHQAEDVTPDVLTLAKGLGGGLPIGACVGFGEFGGVLGKGDHGSTFGANPVSCAAALAVLEVIEADGLLGGGHPGRPAAVRRHRGRVPPAARRGPRPGPVAGRDPDRERGHRRGGGRAAGRFPGQRRPAGRDTARAAADHHRRGGVGLPQRAARHPGRRRRGKGRGKGA